MKKVFLSLAVIASVSLFSCNGSKENKEAEACDQDTTTVVVAEEGVAVEEGDTAAVAEEGAAAAQTETPADAAPADTAETAK